MAELVPEGMISLERVVVVVLPGEREEPEIVLCVELEDELNDVSKLGEEIDGVETLEFAVVEDETWLVEVKVSKGWLESDCVLDVRSLVTESVELESPLVYVEEVMVDAGGWELMVLLDIDTVRESELELLWV